MSARRREEARVGMAGLLIEPRQVRLRRVEVVGGRPVGGVVVDVVEAALEAGLDTVAPGQEGQIVLDDRAALEARTARDGSENTGIAQLAQNRGPSPEVETRERRVRLVRQADFVGQPWLK